MFCNPRQVHLLDKITYRDDSLGGHRAAVNGRHVPLRFGFDVCGRTFPPRRDLADCMGDALPFDCSADTAAFPIADVPAVPNANDLTSLFSASHLLSPFSLTFTGCNG